MRKLNGIACLAIFFFLNNVAWSQSTQRDTIPFDSTVRYGKLKNGLTYYLQKVSNDRKVMIQFDVKAGLFNEENHQLQCAHIIEHIIMEPAMDSLKKIGLAVGRDMNASTGGTLTNYWFILPGNDKDNLARGMHVLRQMAEPKNIDPVSITYGRKSVLAELTYGYDKNSSIRMSDKILTDINPKAAIPHSRLIENINNLKDSSLIKFYKKWYGPDRQAIIIVGDINVNEVEEMVSLSFPDIIGPESKTFDSFHYNPVKVPNFITIQEGSERILIDQYVKHRSFDLFTQSDYRKLLIVEVYNQMSNARFENISDNLENMGASLSYIRAKGLDAPGSVDIFKSSIQFSSAIKKDQIKSSYELFLKEVKRIEEYGFLTSEFIGAKEKILKEKTKTDDMSLFKAAERFEQHFAGRYGAANKEAERKLFISLLNDISLEEVNNTSKKWKSAQPPQILISGKSKFVKTELRSIIAEINKKVSANKVDPYERQEIELRPIMSPKQVEAITNEKIYFTRTTLNEIGAVRYRLQNGIEIILKPVRLSQFKEGKILVNAFKSGKGSILQNNDYSAVLAAGMLNVDSLPSFPRLKLNKYLSKQNIDLSLGLYLSSVAMNGETQVENLEKLMQLIYRYVVNPTHSISAFKEIKIKFAQTHNNDTSTVKRINDRYALSQYQSIPKSFLDTVSIESMKYAYHKYFQDMRDYKFVFTGDFNIDSVEWVITRYLGSIPSCSAPQDPVRYNIIVPSGGSDSYLKKQDKDNNEKDYTASFYVEEKEVTVFKQMQLKVLEGLLQEVLYKKLRVDLGAIYSLTVGSSQIGPNLFKIDFTFGTNVNDPDQLINAAWQEIEKLQTESISGELLKSVIDQVQGGFELRKKNPGFWNYYLYFQYFNEKDISEINSWHEELNKITVHNIQQFAQKFLRHDDLQVYHVN